MLRIAALGALLLALAGPSLAAAPRVHILTDVTLIPAPGERIENATVVLRDGKIISAGPSAKVKIPADARRWDGEGRTVYAAFIESYAEVEAPEAEVGEDGDPGLRGPGSEHQRLRPELRLVDELHADGERFAALRKGGFGAAILVPDGPVFRGQAVAVSLGEGDPRGLVLAPSVAMAASFGRGSWSEGLYPISSMGAMAAFRQALINAEHLRADQEHWRKNSSKRERPLHDISSEALLPVLAGELPLLMPLRGVTLPWRAQALLEEIGMGKLPLLFVTENVQWQRPDMVPDRPHILPLDFRELPKADREDLEAQLSIEWLRAWEFEPRNAVLMDEMGRNFAFTSNGLSEPAEIFTQLRKVHENGLSEATILAALTTRPAELFGLSKTLGRIVPGMGANLVVFRDGGFLDEEAKLEMIFVDGNPHMLDRAKPEKDAEEPDAEAEEAEEAAEDEVVQLPLARSPLQDRGPFEAPREVVFRNATLWTMSGEGPKKGDLHIKDGRIVGLGPDLKVSGGVKAIDARGRHITPGLIDAHSHTAIFGGVNEGVPVVSSEVRIRDILTGESRDIYEQLAGGLTTAHVMHGSANSIGGQNAIIKLRWGATPAGLVFEETTPTIKFALGENPRGANGNGNDSEYPDSRLGVEDVIRSHFSAARDYLARKEYAAKNRSAPPVRRDLRLEAIGEIIAGERLIHSHSYIGPEILMLMRAMEDEGVQVAVFQHVLEGYKVADELRAHGAAASTFADWWGYKYEVIDAIAQNAALMDERGVLVSINSDSGDLARRLNTEAAKVVAQGGATEEAALAMVTINPARQLRIDDRVGSLEVGKHADLVLWNRHPLSSRAVADQTWLDGKLYWDREADRLRQQKLDEEFAALMARAVGDDKEDESDEEDSSMEEGR